MSAALTPDRPAIAPARPGLALTLACLGMATLGFNTVRLAGLAVSDLLFAACGGVIVVQLLTGDTGMLATPEMRRTPPRVLVGAILLLTASTLSSFASWDSAGSAQVIVRFAWLTFVWFWMLRSVSADRRGLASLAAWWRIGVLITAATGVISELGLVQIGVQNAEGRQTGFFGQPNEFAALLAVGLPLFALDTPSPGGGYERRRKTTARLAIIGLVVMAILSSGSMTATFSALVGIGAAAATLALSGASRARARRMRNPIAPMAAFLCAAVGLFFLSTSDLPVIERFTRLREGDRYVEGSIEVRDDRNMQAIQRLPDTLVVGTGPQLAGATTARLTQSVGEDPNAVTGVHNMYLKTAHETGVIGLAGVLLMVGTSLNHSWRLVRNTRGTGLDRLAAALFGATTAAATQAFFHPLAYQRYFWITVAMTGCLWSVRRQELKAGATRPEADRVSPDANLTTGEPPDDPAPRGWGATRRPSGEPGAGRGGWPPTAGA